MRWYLVSCPEAEVLSPRLLEKPLIQFCWDFSYWMYFWEEGVCLPWWDLRWSECASVLMLMGCFYSRHLTFCVVSCYLILDAAIVCLVRVKWVPYCSPDRQKWPLICCEWGARPSDWETGQSCQKAGYTSHRLQCHRCNGASSACCSCLFFFFKLWALSLALKMSCSYFSVGSRPERFGLSIRPMFLRKWRTSHTSWRYLRRKSWRPTLRRLVSSLQLCLLWPVDYTS